MYSLGRNPLAPPPWSLARGRHGVLGGRFDDPGAQWGIPESERFRMLYFATEPAGAIGESIARFRPSPKTIAAGGPTRGVVSREWSGAHEVHSMDLDSASGFAEDGPRFVDIHTPEAVQQLRLALAARAAELGIGDVDLATLLGPERQLTQRAARHIYERFDRAGRPAFHGIRYLSRHNPDWECWALFDTRALPPQQEPGRALAIGSAAALSVHRRELTTACALLGLDLPP